MINDLNTSRKVNDNNLHTIRSSDHTIKVISKDNSMLTNKNESLSNEVLRF